MMQSRAPASRAALPYPDEQLGLVLDPFWQIDERAYRVRGAGFAERSPKIAEVVKEFLEQRSVLTLHRP